MSADVDAMVDEYRKGASLRELAAKTGMPISTVRARVKERGALRSVAEGVRNAAKYGKMSRTNDRIITDEHRASMSRARRRWAEENATGFSIKPSGYREYTRGEHKGRSEHVVKMEKRIGRRLRADECVHHIDGDRLNNDDSNLALMTIAGHARLHRLQDQMAGNERERDSNGRFS